MLIAKYRILTDISDKLYSVADDLMIEGVLDTTSDNRSPQYLFEFYRTFGSQNNSLLFKIDCGSSDYFKMVNVDKNQDEFTYKPERTYRLVHRCYCS
jgi:hypothetical protein